MLNHIKNWLVHKNKNIRHRVLLLSYTVFLFVVTLLPVNSVKNDHFKLISFKHNDKIVHFLLFFTLTLLLKLSYRRFKKLQLFIIPTLIGILIECLQFILNLGRSFEIYDILANSAGALTFILITTKYKP